ncbi:MAG: N4-gp56 family major capsid protein [Christensenellales bacterium]
MDLNRTTTGGMSPTMQTYYDKKLLINARPNLVYQQYGQAIVLPKNSGKTIQFRKWTPFAALTTALNEGVVPDGQSLEMSEVSATIDQYGGYVAVSDMLDLTALDPVINDSVELMGDQGGLSIDALTRDVLHGSTNVQYAGAKTYRHLLSAGGEEPSVLSVDEVRKAVRTLKRNKAPQFVRDGKGYYVAVVGPDTTYDLQSDSLWQDVSKYSASEQIFDGEIGKLFGVVFVETSQAVVYRAQDLTKEHRKLTVKSASGSTVTLKETLTAEAAEALAGRMVIVGGEVLKITAATSGASPTITLAAAPAAALTEDMPVFPGEAGAAGSPVGATLVFGRNAYGVIDLQGGNLKSIIKPRGSGGTADPLDQISTIGWKVDGFAAKVLQPLWMVQIEHAISQ